MKIKLESQKTSLRLSRDEFQLLLDRGTLSECTIFPGGRKLDFQVDLEMEPYLNFDGDKVHIVLPNQFVRTYNPSKSGLSFHFFVNKDKKHHLVFEVDIKKQPLNQRQ